MTDLATEPNVIRINPNYVPEACKHCTTALHAVYQPHHFRTHLRLEVDGTRRAVIDDTAPFRDRGVIIAGIPVGGTAVFEATTPTARAAIRGTAYGWAKLNNARMRAKKLCAEHVLIERVS